MNTTSLLLLRTQSTLRIIERLDESEQRELKPVFIALGLVQRILVGVVDAPDAQFEEIVLDILDEALSTALKAIDTVIEEDEA